MKKILVGALFLITSGILYSPVLASSETVLTAIKQKCSGYAAAGNFAQGISCDGRGDIFYIKDKEVSKVDYDKAKTEFDKKGDICTETVSPSKADLPKDFSYSCTKGSYGKYYYNGKSVSYSEFMMGLLASTLTDLAVTQMVSEIDQLNKEKKLLKSLKSFTKACESGDIVNFSGICPVPKVGSSCMYTGYALYNKTGYDIKECEDEVVLSIEYYWKNKKVNYNSYLKNIYQTEKSENKKVIKALKSKK